MGGESFAEFMDRALYDEGLGFYATTGRAGRRGDFLTSPEVGPLFGAVLARVLDSVWHELGEPEPFVVVDAGAGPGTLARTIRVAEPECAPVLRYVLVERSAAQRVLHADHLPGWQGESVDIDEWVHGRGVGTPVFASSARIPTSITGAIIANELLDNLAFDVVRRVGESYERIEIVDGEPIAVPIADVPLPFVAQPDLPSGVWVPDQSNARHWVSDALAAIERGRLIVFDYGGPTSELAERDDLGWMRTYRGQARGDAPFDAPGTQDITSDIAVDQITFGQPAASLTQAQYLRAAGIDGLVDEGRRAWSERSTTDVVALRARSRVNEADALLDPEGLGAFITLEWRVDPDDHGGAVR